MSFKIKLKCIHLLVCSIFLTISHAQPYSQDIYVSVIQPKVNIEYFTENELIFLETVRYMEIKNGTKLHLRCQADKETVWLFNKKEFFNDPNLRINNVSTGDRKKKKFIIDLMIESTEYNQTGEYSCVYKNEFVDDDKTMIEDFIFISERIYLFVYDNEHLVATKTFVEVPNKSEEYYLRCLPTNPRINVTLYKDSELMIIDNDTLKFHPTVGFIVKDSILDYRKTNLFNCVFKYEDKTDELPFPFQISYVPLDKLSIRMDGDSSENVIVNSTFTLICELETQKVGQMRLYWTYPSTIPIEPIKNSSYIHLNDQMIYINTITLTNITKNYEGKYSCSASNSTIERTQSMDIRVFDLNTTFLINVTSDYGQDAEIEIESGDATLAFTISVWPAKGLDFKISCLKNGILLASSVMKNQLIEMEASESVDSRYGFLFINNQVVISIKGANVSDSGIYTVIGQNSNSFANESVILAIIGPPFIKLNYFHGFFEPNKIYNMIFEIISFPLQNITFERYMCSETECDPSAKHSKWKPLFDKDFYDIFNLIDAKNQNYTITNVDHNITIRSFKKPRYYQILLDLFANQSSIFECTVKNSYDSTISQLPVLVSDAGDEGFQLEVLNDELVEDDNITLICKANKFDYKKINWRWALIDEDIKGNDFNKRIISNETFYSLTSQLTILNAKQNASGMYKCLAEYKVDAQETSSNDENSKQIELIIEKMVPPRITKTNMEKDLKIIEVYQTTSINLYCMVTGRPKPLITWKKNNLPINATTSQSQGIEFNQNNQHLAIKRLVSDDSGKYECIVFNKGGYQSRVLGLKVKDKNDETIPLAGLAGIFTFMVIGCVFVVMAVFLGKRIREDRKQKQELEMFTQKLFNINQNIPFNPDLPLDEQIDLLPYDTKWEFPLDKLTFGPILGEGAFGRVLKAEAEGIDEFNSKTTVAVKMLKDDDMEQRRALMAELKILIHLGKHLNIVNLLGAVTVNAIKGELLVILEYCENGSLRQYLLNNRKYFINQIDPETGEIDTNILEKQDYNYANEEVINSMHRNSNDCYLELTGKLSRASLKRNTSSIDPITSTDLVCFAFQISRGMEYLASRKLIHRDLAIRNVLLAKDNIVKICDFGLAKDCFRYDNYVKKNNGPLPVKWMALECIADKVFTIKSDVWSFSIVLWEIFTLGQNPYPGMDVDEDFYYKLKNGYRMEQPSYCPDGIYEIMKLCWLEDPNERLEFSEISKRLGRYLGENATHYIDLNLPYEEINQTMYLENQGYLPIDNLVNQSGADEEYLDIDLNDEENSLQPNLQSNLQNNYINQSSIDEHLSEKMNNNLSGDRFYTNHKEKITIVDFKNDHSNHTYANI